MTNFVRYLGWAGNIALAALLVDGFCHFLHLSLHVRWGLGITLSLPLIYLLPYFHLIGVSARIKARTEEDPEAWDAYRLSQQLKGRLFWSTLLAVIMCIIGPVLAFIGGIPPMAHGIYMVVFSLVHVMTWARSLFVLELSDEIVSLR